MKQTAWITAIRIGQLLFLLAVLGSFVTLGVMFALPFVTFH